MRIFDNTLVYKNFNQLIYNLDNVENFSYFNDKVI